MAHMRWFKNSAVALYRRHTDGKSYCLEGATCQCVRLAWPMHIAVVNPDAQEQKPVCPTSACIYAIKPQRTLNCNYRPLHAIAWVCLVCTVPAKQTKRVHQRASCRPRKSPSAPNTSCPAIMPRMAAEETKLSSAVDSDGYCLAMILRARPTLTCDGVWRVETEIVSANINTQNVNTTHVHGLHTLIWNQQL